MGLAEDTKKLAEDIVASYDLRVKEIRKLAKDTQSMLKEFQGEQKGMAAELKKTFKQEEADRLKAEADRIKAFGSMKNEIQAEQEKRNKAVADLLEKFAKDHEAMANELRGTLAEGEAERNKAVADLLEKFAKDHEDMAAELRKTLKEGEVVRLKEVLNLLQEFKTEREKMAANWQALTAAMAKRRSIKLKVETEVKARPVEEAIKEMEEKVTPETDLEEKVLEFIERHPEGVRVGDIEEPLGVPRMRLGQVAKRLLKKGDVRREGNIYFPL
ncbi:MAG: hypothetical protein COT09_01660 [Candidatus Hydromicrobium americanum]|nr:MAG: hypothetical protein COT09_01660 [Candidatus Hydromicrobium americanum]